MKCYNCQKIGHYASDCRSKKREDHYASHCRSKIRENQAQLTETQSDEDEPALLTAQVCEVRTLSSPELTEMALYEEKVVPEEIEKKKTIWFLDMGASNHMTGCRSWFSELKESRTGMVKFGDGSLVEIKGRGDVMLQCENGDHCILSDVYFIPKLKSNIISLGQLDDRAVKLRSNMVYLSFSQRQRSSWQK